MRIWILIAVVIVAVAAGTLSAREPDAKELAQKGYNGLPSRAPPLAPPQPQDRFQPEWF